MSPPSPWSVSQSQAEVDLVTFKEQVDTWPFVRESYLMSGEVVFLLKCVAPDLAAFQAFIIDELTAAPNVDSVRTMLTIRKTKDEPLLEIE